MPVPFLLICHLGQNDVQVVHSLEDGRITRVPLARGSIRRFHEDCLANPDSGQSRVSWVVLDEERMLQVSQQREESYRAEYDQAQGVLKAQMTAISSAGGWEKDVAKTVTLCVPILARLRDYLLSELSGRVGRALHILLLNSGTEGSGEPVAAGTIARVMLEKMFELSGDHIEEFNYAATGPLLVSDASLQQHVSPIVAQRIDKKIKELARLYSQQKPLIAFADAAGIPEVKPVIAASCRYRFGTSALLFVRPPEPGRMLDRVAEQAASLVAPEESLETRRQIVNLARNGCFEAAGALAMPTEDPRYLSEPWRRWVTFIPRVLANDFRLEGFSDESQICTVLRQVIRTGPLAAAAIRTEAALRRRDWPTAIAGTVTVYEIVRLNAVIKLCSNPGQKCVSDDGMHLLPEKMTERFQAVTRPYDPGQYFGWNDSHRLDPLLDLLVPQRPAMTAFRYALKAQRSGEPFLFLRNHVAHSFLTSDSISHGQKIATELGLWSSSHRFLVPGAAKAKDMLAEAGWPEALTVFNSLIKAIQQDIDLGLN